MPIPLTNMRNLMLPGLQQMAASYALTKEQWAAEIFNDPILTPVKSVSLKAALLAGVAAAVMKNPIISRRFWGL
jgi:hypothetical protein